MYSYGKAFSEKNLNKVKLTAESIVADIKSGSPIPFYECRLENMDANKCKKLYSAVNNELKKVITDYKLEMTTRYDQCYAYVRPSL